MPDRSVGRLAEMTRTMTFTATAQARPRGGIAIALPFDPAEAWGDRDRYYLAQHDRAHPMRATVTPAGAEPMLKLGPAWCRDPRVGPGASLQLSLHPEGPQLDTISPDFADALRAEPGGSTPLRVVGDVLSERIRDLDRGSEASRDAGAADCRNGRDLKAGRRERSDR
jgi:hypothetical protein